MKQKNFSKKIILLALASLIVTATAMGVTFLETPIDFPVNI